VVCRNDANERGLTKSAGERSSVGQRHHHCTLFL
jgi:hypothetical protein